LERKVWSSRKNWTIAGVEEDEEEVEELWSRDEAEFADETEDDDEDEDEEEEEEETC
jgi:hypothetical protein